MLSLSGIDGAGKSTQAALVGNYLAAGSAIFVSDLFRRRSYEDPGELDAIRAATSDAQVIVSRFYVPSSQTLRLQDCVKNRTAHTPEEHTALARQTFAAAHADAALWQRLFVSPHIEAGHTLIFDRYFYDEAIYRVLDGLDPLELLTSYANFPIPDLAIWIDVPVAALSARNASRPDGDSPLFRQRHRLKFLRRTFRTISTQVGLVRIAGGVEVTRAHESIVRRVQALTQPGSGE